MREIKLDNLKKLIDKIQLEYNCDSSEGLACNDYLNAKEGFELLIELLEKD